MKIIKAECLDVQLVDILLTQKKWNLSTQVVNDLHQTYILNTEKNKSR